MKIQEYILFMIFIGASIAISLWALILSNSGLINHQQILQAISGTQQSIEMQISELSLQEPSMNDCSIYCNSVSCWCDEEAYKERDKMDNNNPEKWLFIEEQGKKNYFDRTKIK